LYTIFMMNETLMMTDRPEILDALERTVSKVNCPFADPYEINRNLLRTALIDREDRGCSVYIAETDDVLSGGNRYCDGDLNKIRCDLFKVVYWGEHPAECFFEEAIADGELGEEIDEIPEDMWEQGEQCLHDLVEVEVTERLGMNVEVVSSESKLHSPYGGWVVLVRSSNRYSVDLTRRDAIARVIAS
jgi:hypothetical protein